MYEQAAKAEGIRNGVWMQKMQYLVLLTSAARYRVRLCVYENVCECCVGLLGVLLLLLTLSVPSIQPAIEEVIDHNKSRGCPWECLFDRSSSRKCSRDYFGARHRSLAEVPFARLYPAT